MTTRFDLPPADYLVKACYEEILRIFWLRSNESLEFSALRVALEARGIKATSDNHWGILAASLKNAGTLELVGREVAVAASRNQARNGAYRLSDDIWNYVANLLAPARGWPLPESTRDNDSPEQTVLVP